MPPPYIKMGQQYKGLLTYSRWYTKIPALIFKENEMEESTPGVARGYVIISLYLLIIRISPLLEMRADTVLYRYPG